MEINDFHNPDSVWTWRPNPRRHKASLWLPYFEKVERLPKGKGDRYVFYYNGGEVQAHLKEIDFLMFYGASGNLDLEFLDKLNSYKIPLMIHRRNLDTPYLFFPQSNVDASDILTKQILTRENEIKCCYLARTLLRERFRHFEKYFLCNTYIHKLRKVRSIKEIRNIEALLTKAYWKRWFSEIGLTGMVRRQDPQDKHPVNEALDAASFFFYGIMLRWILFHKLSPYHGFLHEPSSYTSLVFDLMEPYRYILEDTVKEASLKIPSEEYKKSLTAITLNILKEKMETKIYIPQTRQEVKLKNLLHGIVLALRSYLINETARFVVPTEGIKKGGRPLKLKYRLPG